MSKYTADTKRKPAIVYVVTGSLLIFGGISILIGIISVIKDDSSPIYYLFLGSILLFTAQRFWSRVTRNAEK